MSLNGLDDPKVVEAHEAATAEPGGWFLLKYESRDEIQVYNRGNGGIVEVRNAVAEYNEMSPLYGFLKYRRRSVVIKYLPEDCSRIIQARVAVHFNAVCERFSPYDTIFEIMNAGDLKDSKLSAACSLHTATCSTSSSTSSLRRRRLMEIAEEEEDEQRATKRQSVPGTDESRPQPLDYRPSTAGPVTLNSELASSPENSKFSAATTSDVPQFIGVNERPTSPDSDVYTVGSYPYSKPRVKLGPRPSVDTNGRPQTAGNYRPVSAIPAGFKMFGKGGKKVKGKDGSAVLSSQDEIASLNFSLSASNGSDDVEDRPMTRSSSIMEPVPLPTSVPKKPTISPEKARLMKAMQLREKRKKKRAGMALLEDGPTVDGEEPTNAEDVKDDIPQVANEAISSSAADFEKEGRRISLDKDDSGVVLDTLTPSVPVDQASDLTPLDSHPASPLVDSSEAGHSTKASSISESTDETVHAKETEDKEIETPTSDDKYTTDGAKEAKSDELGADDVTDVSQLAVEALAGDIEPATTIAELSTTTGVPEDIKAGYNGDENLGNIALPVSKFSVNAPPPLNPDDGTPTIPETPSPETHKIATGRTAQSPTLKTKVSAQDLLAAANAASQPTVVPPGPIIEESPCVGANAHDINNTMSTKDSEASALPTQDEKAKRRSQIEPIQTINLKQKDGVEVDVQNATHEEAIPTPIVETPVTTSFPPSPSKGQDIHAIRTVSNPVRGNLIVPVDATQPSASRSMSSGAAYLHHVTQHQQSGNLAKKSNIGSSISQRIKALEKLSAASGDAPAAPVRERPSSTFFAVKKREPSRSPSVLDRANSFRDQTPPSPDQGHESSSPDASRRNRLERSGSVTNRLSMFESPTSSSAPPRNLGVPSATAARGRPESVSVMARIVRDPNYVGPMNFEPSRDLSEYSHLELKQSPLLVDHQAASSSSTLEKDYTPDVDQTQDRGTEAREHGKATTGKSRQSSLSIVKGFIKERRKSVASDVGNATPYSPGRPESVHTNSAAFSPRMSISSPRSSFSKDREPVLSPAESGFGDDAKSAHGDKSKLSRAGRFMRRLSNLSGSRSKNNLSTISATDEAADPIQSRPSTTGTPTIVSYLGDVNVQFPDNLLWKRRNMCLDSQGFLILSALPAQNGRPAQGTKRYHLSEFHAPYIPDVEVQELPNSVVLDFIEGAGIQVACEDRASQLSVLHVLQEAHSTRSTTYAL
ncbi:hypothetical protein QQS21_001754 [Conoideocrella luteorostrata]|uniref:ADF-H domain-containing protein n=1 Tax=Conoideocrella luteorostrata TaxID=1105319 RepID=A0AAJ0FXW8_9HYPO|nr:hypothetical protein QQS21_001754 [Conoideocrella luteorostrata]